MLEYRALNTHICRAVDLMLVEPAISDSEVVAKLARAGCERDLAILIIDYIPSAFADPMLKEHGVRRAPYYLRHLTNGEQIEITLEDDPVWRAVRRSVREYIRPNTINEYRTIVESSVEFDSISKALAAGADLAGSVVAIAPLHELDPDSPFLPSTIRTQPLGYWRKLILQFQKLGSRS